MNTNDYDPEAKHLESLHAYLVAGGDLGAKTADAICDAVLNNTYERAKDPISDIIVNAFLDSEYDRSQMIDDLDYAINQLRRAQDAMHLHGLDESW